MLICTCPHINNKRMMIEGEVDLNNSSFEIAPEIRNTVFAVKLKTENAI
jgi:hypothetical protein